MGCLTAPVLPLLLLLLWWQPEKPYSSSRGLRRTKPLVAPQGPDMAGGDLGGGSFKEQPGLLLPTHLPAASVPLQVTLLPRDCCCSRCRRCNLFPLGGPSLQHTLPWSLQCGQGKRCGEDWRGLPHTHTHSLRPRQVGATTTGTSQGSAKSDGAGSPLLPISSTCSAPPIRPPRDQTG